MAADKAFQSSALVVDLDLLPMLSLFGAYEQSQKIGMSGHLALLQQHSLHKPNSGGQCMDARRFLPSGSAAAARRPATR